MPYSSPEGKDWAFTAVGSLDPPPELVLDVGAGAGEWRHRLAPALPYASWHAVEIFEPYVERFQLRDYYDRVFVADARKLIFADYEVYDLAIFGDVIEHMEKAEAIDMVACLPWRNALISVPIVEYPQAASEGNPFEAHVATWSYEEVMGTFRVEQSFRGAQVGVFLL